MKGYSQKLHKGGRENRSNVVQDVFYRYGIKFLDTYTMECFRFPRDVYIN